MPIPVQTRSAALTLALLAATACDPGRAATERLPELAPVQVSSSAAPARPSGATDALAEA